MSSSRGKPRPKAYLSIGEYLRKAGAFKTVNVYYNDIISTHPSVDLSDNGDDEAVDEVAQGMIDAAQHGHVETLRFLAAKAQTGGEEGGLGTCIGERTASLMLHLAAEHGHDAVVHYLVEDLWVDVDAATVRGMTALHYGAKANRTAVVRELARLGADLEARNDSGQVPAAMTKDRLLRRLFQQYLGGGAWTSAPMIDRFVPSSASRVVDYVAVMTVKLAPQLQAHSDQLSDVRQATVAEIVRFPVDDHRDTPMADTTNLAEICTQTCKGESGPLATYSTLLTDMSGQRSHVVSKVLGVYQDAAQRGRARILTTLTGPSDAAQAPTCAAGELTARVVLVLARHPFTAAFASACEHIAELILEEAPKWGSLDMWPLDLNEERRNAQIKFAMEYYATEMPLPLPSREARIEVLGRTLRYGDAHAAHSSFPHLETADVKRLTSRLGPDVILTALACLLQEQSVLVLSEHVEDLAPVMTAFLGFLFPMRWPHTVIPVLPASLIHYLEAPVPFLMGMHVSELARVSADLSCITIVNLARNKVVLPIRPITSVSTVTSSTPNGSEPHRRPSRRDSTTRSLAEIPIAVRGQAERRIRRCVPLDNAPPTDRVINRHQPRAASLYIPGIRVAVVDALVALIGPYQTYRYVPGAQQRMISEAPTDHRSFLEAVFSTQLWGMFREDLLAEEGNARIDPWEAQAQLFCACVERARHQKRPGGGTPGESHSCQDVLYPSEDVEQQLSLLSMYPTPESLAEFEAEDQDVSTTLDSEEGSGRATQGGEATAEVTLQDSLQEKTDEVLQSITSSFAAVTDIFVPKDGEHSSSPFSKKLARSDGAEKQSAGGGVSGGVGSGLSPAEVTLSGWDIFKPPSMAKVKRRLESGGHSVSPTRANVSPSVASKSANTTPTGGGGFGMFGDSFRDFRRRSQEAVDEAVTKLKSAFDGEDEPAEGSRANAGGVSPATERGSAAIRAAARSGRAGYASTEGDLFWSPFGDAPGTSEEPVPVPPLSPAQEAGLAMSSSFSNSKSTSPGRISAKQQLDSYYGGGSGGER